MTALPEGNPAHSIHERLKNEARARGRPFVEVLELFAIERFLHRLGRSAQREHFVLKGALLLRGWLGAETRPTRDIDLLGPADIDAERLRRALAEILAIEVEDDAIEYRPESIAVAPIRVESPVSGLRAKFDATLGRAKLRYQVDVGLGDSVFPPTEDVVPGGLLGMPMASVRAYTPYTTVAEKLEAVVVLGEANSRIKDYYDLTLLARTLAFDGPTQVEALQRTFERRSTMLPEEVPVGLTTEFAIEPRNVGRWRAFLDKGGLLRDERPELEGIVTEIRSFAVPVFDAARGSTGFPRQWTPGGPWV